MGLWDIAKIESGCQRSVLRELMLEPALVRASDSS
jgi:hypothetical protein